jgi:transketolase
MSRRAVRVTAAEIAAAGEAALAPTELAAFETFDMLYRSLCALLYNYVPTSGHPGGSISSGRFVAGIVFDGLDYDLGAPDRQDADVLSYAAGHKAMGLYAMWALRDEIARLAAPELLPGDDRDRLRLEDLLGFRRNPTNAAPLFAALHARALDGHPTPATPFVRLSTGASGVGLASSIGLAIGARDRFGENCPQVHISEGEGGLTPGRVSEALAAAGTASLANVTVHVDYNQASIDSDHVCREGDVPGDYVQWEPGELFYLHDWNVVKVADGHDFQQIVAAQRYARAIDNGQPTAVVYRTHKGWKYGVEGRASHGGGHKLCSAGFHQSLSELIEQSTASLPTCDLTNPPCAGPGGDQVREECFWEALQVVRQRLEKDQPVVEILAGRLVAARERLEEHGRVVRQSAPRVEAVYELATRAAGEIPEELRLAHGGSTTLREALGRALQLFNQSSGGSLLTASADLLGSTSVATIAADFAPGYWNAATNPEARLLSIGGICEDAMAGVLSGISAYGHSIGVGSSYGAFMAPLGHIAARLHAIGAEARRTSKGEPYRSLILICGHAGLATGEDGPTHADPQALQLLQENFPIGAAVTLTPWEPQEIWPLLATALAQRPAFIAPFVTRPEVKVLDRRALGLAAPEQATTGVYLLRRPRGTGDVTIVLQESAVTYAFVADTMPLLEHEGIDARVYYVASAELFDALPRKRQHELFPEAHAFEAIGITGFTLPTLYRWVRSDAGREAALHPYRDRHYLGSGKAEVVLAEAGLDGASQFAAIKKYLDAKVRSNASTL